MQILKKSNGIDLKARGTALHGNAVITLKDATTGRITEQIEHKNFFTKALDSAYNGCPFGLDSLMKMGEGVFCDNRANDKFTYKFGDIYKSLLGGIICFPESLGNSVDDYFPSFTDNFPTAYASMADYSITDSRQGTYDGVSSGKIANGYRYVYDWGSSVGNGRISAIALSHKNSFEYFKNPVNMLYPKVSTQDHTRGYYGRVIANPSGDKGVVAMTDKYLICINEDGNNHRNIECHELPCFNIGLTNRYDGVTINDGSYKWAINLYEHGFGVVIWQIYEGYLWGMHKGSGGSSGVSFAKINIETGELTIISKTWTTPNATNSARGVALKNGYFYIGQTTAGKIYKCNMDNVADVTEIECGAVANCGLYTTDSMPYIFGTNIIINDDTVITHSANNPIAATTINTPYPLYQNGVWIVSSNGWSQSLSAQMLTPYCATKNNLESPITKTAEKQMVITYTVTQE